MGRRRSSSSETTTTEETTTTTSSMDGGGGGMDGGDGGGDGGMGMGNACFVYPGAPATPGLATPNVVYNREAAMNGSMTMDDGTVVPMWGFIDTDAAGGGMGGMDGGGMGGVAPFPSPAMRVRVGQIVHTNLTVGMMQGVHTIHHHGIEPHFSSDGVGHITWDVPGGSTYTYQWRPSSPGTYFYHCHTNTVLHAEMGMYGALIVDPPEGPGTTYSGGPTYDMEAFWVVDEIDTRWHGLDWAAGTCGQDVGLNVLDPDYFIITGVDGSGSSAIDALPIAANMQVGDTLLARYICAGYHPQRIRFGGLTGEVVISDGRVLPNPIRVQELRACSGERYDILFRPTQAGNYIVETDIIHWVTGNVLGTTRTNIRVSG